MKFHVIFPLISNDKGEIPFILNILYSGFYYGIVTDYSMCIASFKSMVNRANKYTSLNIRNIHYI
ncbi:hypothetical protein J19TS1_38880 [Heyndrickxia oleronia]|nr:hypothetical protein J19TS1_38880 [Heyndrickxia oleronia]